MAVITDTPDATSCAEGVVPIRPEDDDELNRIEWMDFDLAPEHFFVFWDIAGRRELSYGARLLYGIMASVSDEGAVFVGTPKLAQLMGTTVEEVRDFKRELRLAASSGVTTSSPNPGGAASERP